MSHDIICHISFNQKVVYAMSSQCPVEGVMDGTVPDIGTIHCSTQVEVDGISPQSECLSHMPHFCVLNPERVSNMHVTESATVALSLSTRDCHAHIWSSSSMVKQEAAHLSSVWEHYLRRHL